MKLSGNRTPIIYSPVKPDGSELENEEYSALLKEKCASIFISFNYMKNNVFAESNGKVKEENGYFYLEKQKESKKVINALTTTKPKRAAIPHLNRGSVVQNNYLGRKKEQKATCLYLEENANRRAEKTAWDNIKERMKTKYDHFSEYRRFNNSVCHSDMNQYFVELTSICAAFLLAMQNKNLTADNIITYCENMKMKGNVEKVTDVFYQGKGVFLKQINKFIDDDNEVIKLYGYMKSIIKKLKEEDRLKLYQCHVFMRYFNDCKRVNDLKNNSHDREEKKTDEKYIVNHDMRRIFLPIRWYIDQANCLYREIRNLKNNVEFSFVEYSTLKNPKRVFQEVLYEYNNQFKNMLFDMIYLYDERSYRGHALLYLKRLFERQKAKIEIGQSEAGRKLLNNRFKIAISILNLITESTDPKLSKSPFLIIRDAAVDKGLKAKLSQLTCDCEIVELYDQLLFMLLSLLNDHDGISQKKGNKCHGIKDAFGHLLSIDNLDLYYEVLIRFILNFEINIDDSEQFFELFKNEISEERVRREKSPATELSTSV